MLNQKFDGDVEKGWNWIVQPLIALCNHHDVVILQIKEKFGGLRFYVGAAPEWIHDLIHAVELASYSLCEKCGKEGKTRGDIGWWKTLCDDHYKERAADYEKRIRANPVSQLYEVY